MKKHSLITVLRTTALASLLTAGAVHAEPVEDGRAAQASTGLRMGSATVEGFADLLVPIAEVGGSVFLLNPRFSLKDEGENEVNLGLLWRHWLPGADVVVGANAWHDSRKTRHDNRFNQIGFGLELLGERFDARVNWYRADDEHKVFNEFTTRDTDTRTEVSSRRDVSTRRQIEIELDTTTQSEITISSEYGAPYAQEHSILQDVDRDITNRTVTDRTLTRTITDTTTTRNTRTTRRTTTHTDRLFQQFEAGLDGFDAELGYKLPLANTSTEVRLFAGYYDFDNPFGEDIEGYKGRVEVRAGPYLTFDAEVFDDERLNGTDYFVGLRLHVPLHGRNTWKRFREGLRDNARRSVAERRFHDMVMRDVRVQTAESDPIEDVERRKVTTEVDVSQQVSRSTATETHVETSRERVGDVVTNSEEMVTEVIADDVTFVDADNDSGTQDGTFEDPWRGLQEGLDEGFASGHNTIFLCESGGGVCDLAGGGGSYDETVVMHENQVLTSSIEANGGQFFETANLPVIAPTDDGGQIAAITLAQQTTVHRVAINTTAIADGLTGIGTISASTVGDLSVTSSLITTSGDFADGIRINSDTPGSVTISGNIIDVEGRGADAIFLDRDGADDSILISENVLLTDGLEANGIEGTFRSAYLSLTAIGNTITTSGESADGINWNASSSATTNAMATIEDNEITTEGEFSDGIVTNFNGAGSTVEIRDNTIVVGGDDANGIDTSNNADEGTTRVVGNSVTTSGIRGIGIETDNDGVNHLTEIATNTIETSGTSADGVVTRNEDGILRIIDNEITTTNSGANGIESHDRNMNSVLISANIIRTEGANSHGMDVRAGNSFGTGHFITIADNEIETLADGARAIYFTSASTGTTHLISGNIASTTGDNAAGILVDRTGTGSATDIDGNTVTTTGTNSASVELDGTDCMTVIGNDLAATNADEILIPDGTPVGNRTTLATDNELNGGTVNDGGSVACP